MDSSLIDTIAVVSPGFVIFLVGTTLRLVARRSRPDSMLGIRIAIVGVLLVFVIPGVAVLFGVVVGRLMWPAILAPIILFFYGYRMLRVARRYWTQEMPIAVNAPRDARTR